MYVLTKCVAIKIAVVFFFLRSSPLRIYFSNRRYDTLKGVATKNLPPQTPVDMTAANWQRSPFLFSSGTSIASKIFPHCHILPSTPDRTTRRISLWHRIHVLSVFSRPYLRHHAIVNSESATLISSWT